MPSGSDPKDRLLVRLDEVDKVFWRRSKSVEDQIESYMEHVDECIEVFLKAMRVFLSEGRTSDFEKLTERCHTVESAADDLRREIEITLYGKALLPESRGDLLGMLESFDRVPNRAETVLFMISCQRLDIPADFSDDLMRLVEVNVETYGLVRKAFDALLSNPMQTLYVVKEVEESESRSDRMERSLIGRIFDTDYSDGRKLLLKDLVLSIGNLSDRSENTADRIAIVAVKRRV
jgi:predicted phosphate transport protein (TIGR00153 family)